MLKKTPLTEEEIDRAGQAVLRAGAATEAEVEAAASAPFLFTRVRSAIAAEQKRQDEAGGWLSLLFVARRAVPGMALVALMVAMILVWSAQFNVTSNNFDEDALLGTPGPGVEQTVLADRNNLSQDDIFNIVLDREYGRNTR